MPKINMRIGLGGSIKAVHSDEYNFMAVHGCNPPVRASQVEPIQSGPNVGLWFVDMSLLGEKFAYCLWPPFETRRAALEAEHDHIEKNWVFNNTPTESK